MRGQLYRGHTNATALSSSLVVSALGSESDDPGHFSSPVCLLCVEGEGGKGKFFFRGGVAWFSRETQGRSVVTNRIWKKDYRKVTAN